MRILTSLFTIILTLCCSAALYAQNENGKSVIGETMRSNGRIYVVVAVMLVILAGLVLYLVRLDRKMSKMEKEQ